MGTGLVAGFLARTVQQESVELLVSTPVRELLQDDEGAVVGVRAEGPDGVVERHGPVVLATSTYDWDPRAGVRVPRAARGRLREHGARQHPWRRHQAGAERRCSDRNGFPPRACRWFLGGVSPTGSPTDPSTPCRTR